METMQLFKTKFGLCCIEKSQKGIKRLFFTDGKRSCKANGKDNRQTNYFRNQIARYFRGINVKFNAPLDLDGCTQFQKRVFDIITEIPFGEVKTYGWVAKKVKSSPRGVGQALAKNLIPIIIPCHRVIMSNGRLGGYSGRGGISLKRRLLNLEGINKLPKI